MKQAYSTEGQGFDGNLNATSLKENTLRCRLIAAALCPLMLTVACEPEEKADIEGAATQASILIKPAVSAGREFVEIRRLYDDALIAGLGDSLGHRVLEDSVQSALLTEAEREAQLESLGVQYYATTTISGSEKNIYVTVRFFQFPEGRLWTETFSGKREDIQAIARAVVDKIDSSTRR